MKHIQIKRLLVLALCMMLLVTALPVRSAEAASNGCKQINGNSKGITVFYVETQKKKNDTLKFTATKGVMKTIDNGLFPGANYSGDVDNISQNKPNDTRKMYETFSIKVEKLSEKGKVVSTKEYMLDGGSEKITLDKNSYYRITVAPLFKEFYEQMMDHYYYIRNLKRNPYNSASDNMVSRLFYGIGKTKWKPLGWKTHATWKISSSGGVISCFK